MRLRPKRKGKQEKLSEAAALRTRARVDRPWTGRGTVGAWAAVPTALGESFLPSQTLLPSACPPLFVDSPEGPGPSWAQTCLTDGTVGDPGWSLAVFKAPSGSPSYVCSWWQVRFPEKEPEAQRVVMAPIKWQNWSLNPVLLTPRRAPARAVARPFPGLRV